MAIDLSSNAVSKSSLIGNLKRISFLIFKMVYTENVSIGISPRSYENKSKSN